MASGARDRSRSPPASRCCTVASSPAEAPPPPGLAARSAIGLDAPGLPAEASGAPLIGADGRLAGLAQVIQGRGRTTRAALSWNAVAERLGELRPGGRAA